MPLAGWTKRKKVTLSRASGAVTNYQMKLLVGESAGSGTNDVLATGCKTDFSDLRFTAADGVTLLDYWIETTSMTGATPNQVATIWIEFNSIGTGATAFYMYYGNSGASAVSNGDNTFQFFDDFPGSSLDTTTKWTVTGDGSVTVASSIVSANFVTSGTFLTSKSTFSTNTRCRGLFKFPAINKYSSFGYVDASNYGTMFQTNFPTINVLSGNNRNPYPTETTTSFGNVGANAFYIYDVKRNTSTSVYYNFNGTEQNLTTNVVTRVLPVYLAGQGQTSYLDWCFIGQWLATEPAWGSWDAAETIWAIPSRGIIIG